MKSRVLIVAIAQVGILSGGGCTDRGADSVPQNGNNQPLVLSVQPESAQIGSLISIRGARYALPATVYLGDFPGADAPLVADSGSDSTIYTFVPFGAISGQLSVYTGQSPGTTRLLGRTNILTVESTVDTLALTVDWYDLSPPLTAGDSSVVDIMGNRRAWHAIFQGDTVDLRRGFSAGEEYYEYQLGLVDNGPNLLPRMRYFWIYTAPDYPGAWTDTIHAGILKVQDWNTDKSISGRFFGKPSTRHLHNGTIAFWVDLKR